jgi:hypothetical protein
MARPARHYQHAHVTSAHTAEERPQLDKVAAGEPAWSPSTRLRSSGPTPHMRPLTACCGVCRAVVGVLKGVAATGLGFLLLGGVQFSPLNILGILMNLAGGVWCVPALEGCPREGDSAGWARHTLRLLQNV